MALFRQLTSPFPLRTLVAIAGTLLVVNTAGAEGRLVEPGRGREQLRRRFAKGQQRDRQSEARVPQMREVRVELNEIKPVHPKTLVGEGKTKLPNGATIEQRVWRYVLPHQPGLDKPTREPPVREGNITRQRTLVPTPHGVAVEEIETRLPEAGGGMPQMLGGLAGSEAPGGVDAETVKAMQSFTQVLGMAKEAFVDEMSDAEILRNAARGIAAGLDKYSGYFDEREFAELNRSLSGQGVGVGVMLGGKPGELKAAKIIPGSPAHRAGMRRGDKLVAIDGKPIEFKEVKDLEGVVEALRGEAGSEVAVRVERKGAAEPIELKIERAALEYNPLQARATRDGIAIVRLPQFDTDAAKRVKSAVDGLQQEQEGGLKGMVLDLRKNPGGNLEDAVDIANYFVEEGTLVTTRGRGGVIMSEHKADPAKAAFKDLPLAVLIDGNSASASELVSGTLRDLDRAVLLGEKSYGKGTVQITAPLPDGGVKMTVARYHTASGKTPDKVGIEPDITKAEAKKRHLARSPRQTNADYVLQEALAVLRGESQPPKAPAADGE